MTQFIQSLQFLIVAVIMSATPGHAFSASARAGDVFEILSIYETQEEENGEFSSSSSGRTAIIERVLRVEENGIELEYDEPLEKDGTSKGRNWQLPARVFRPFDGEPTLLNTEELEARLDPWLAKAKFPRAACGQWIFTWDAFKIECDPASALGIIKQYDLWVANLSDGQPFSDRYASDTMPLRQQTKDANSTIYIVELAVNPEIIKQSEAESDVVVSKIMGEPKSLEDALRDQAGKKISGTMSVEIEADPSGLIKKQTTVTKVQVVKPSGEIESRVSTVTLQRKLLSSQQATSPQ